MGERNRFRAVVVAAAVALSVVGCQAQRDDRAHVTDGMVVSVDDGLVYFLWDGGRQRIQQPAALTEADLLELGLEIGEAAPATLTVGTETTRFVVYPYDGADARLYLVQAGTLHAVDVVQASHDDISGRADLEALVIDRVQLP